MAGGFSSPFRSCSRHFFVRFALLFGYTLMIYTPTFIKPIDSKESKSCGFLHVSSGPSTSIPNLFSCTRSRQTNRSQFKRLNEHHPIYQHSPRYHTRRNSHSGRLSRQKQLENCCEDFNKSISTNTFMDELELQDRRMNRVAKQHSEPTRYASEENLSVKQKVFVQLHNNKSEETCQNLTPVHGISGSCLSDIKSGSSSSQIISVLEDKPNAIEIRRVSVDCLKYCPLSAEHQYPMDTSTVADKLLYVSNIGNKIHILYNQDRKNLEQPKHLPTMDDAQLGVLTPFLHSLGRPGRGVQIPVHVVKRSLNETQMPSLNTRSSRSSTKFTNQNWISACKTRLKARMSIRRNAVFSERMGSLRSNPLAFQREEIESPFSVYSMSSLEDSRVLINVSGMKFETWYIVLDKHADTLLGNADKRKPFYDPARREYFFDRHRPSFEAIFNYYQYGGRIKRPTVVTDDVFLNELLFFEIESEAIDLYKKHEGYVSEVIMLPEISHKRNLWLHLEYPETSVKAFALSAMSVVFTIISIILFCVETLPTFAQTHCEPKDKPNFLDPFFIIETVCTVWFTCELFLRLYCCPSKLAFIKDIKNWIDVIAIVPYYITLINVLISFSCEGAKNSARLAFLRVIRLIRVFKLTKHSSGLQVLVLTFKESIEGLAVFLVAFIVCILVFSSTIYYVEMDDKGSQIHSIPDAFWWAVITMCTVGYGDKIPKSPLGKIVGSVCAVAGVLTLAIPVPIITENFNKFYAHKTGRPRR